MNFLENLPVYKAICTTRDTDIEESVRATILVDNKFPATVQNEINKQDPVCAIIRESESKTSKLHEIVEMWLAYRNDEQNGTHSDYTQSIIEMALSPIALTSFFVNPNSTKSLLKSNDKSVINGFLMDHLDNTGLDELYNYTEKRRIFEKLYERKLKPLVFWKMATPECSQLATLAIKLLSIPSSNSQIERVFSNWASIHTKLRNRLTSDRSKKLIHMYYSFTTRIEKNNPRKQKESSQQQSSFPEEPTTTRERNVREEGEEEDTETDSESEGQFSLHDTDEDASEIEELYRELQNKY